MHRFATLLLAGVLAASVLLLPTPETHAQCSGGMCGGNAQTATYGACSRPGPIRRYFRWLRARRQANAARIRSGRLPRVFPLLWR